MTPGHSYYNKWLHRFAKLVAGATFLLIVVGGLVTSTGSGLAVPDWPTTYGHFMFSFPLSQMVGGILYEHGHRMVASVVGMLMVILAVWLWLKEPRRWVRWLGAASLLTVILQGLLGGLTVMLLLPTPVSVFHACLAQAFFMLTISLAMVTSREWEETTPEIHDTRLPNLALATVAAVFVQLILGAVMRHTGSGLAIPDFPLAFGRIIPPIQSQAVAIHFLHRVGALVVTVCVVWTVGHIFRRHRSERRLTRPAALLLLALVLQIMLAAWTIWSRKAVLPTTAHVATGAFVLGNSLFLLLRTQKLVVAHTREQEVLIEQPSVS